MVSCNIVADSSNCKATKNRNLFDPLDNPGNINISYFHNLYLYLSPPPYRFQFLFIIYCDFNHISVVGGGGTTIMTPKSKNWFFLIHYRVSENQWFWVVLESAGRKQLVGLTNSLIVIYRNFFYINLSICWCVLSVNTSYYRSTA